MALVVLWVMPIHRFVNAEVASSNVASQLPLRPTDMKGDDGQTWKNTRCWRPPPAIVALCSDCYWGMRHSELTDELTGEFMTEQLETRSGQDDGAICTCCAAQPTKAEQSPITEVDSHSSRTSWALKIVGGGTELARLW